MNELEKALPELEKLAAGLGVNTADAHATFKAVLANLHVRLKNLEAVALPALEQVAEQVATQVIENEVAK